MSGSRIVIVGGGLAAVRTAQELRRRGHIGPVRMISDESVEPYDRPPLSKRYLSGEAADASLRIIPAEAFEKLDVDLSLGSAAVELDTDSGTVTLADGSAVPYDQLIVASGARARSLPVLARHPCAYTLRTVADARALAAALRRRPRVVIIGGGFIGLEVAATARGAGCGVTVVEAQSAPLVDVIGARSAGWLRDQHLARGVTFRCGVTVAATSSPRPDSISLHLTDGSVVAADVVVQGVGVERDVGWLQAAGLEVAAGLICDEAGRTNIPNVFGAGDIVCHRHGDGYRAIAHWTSAGDSARQAAQAVLALDPPGLSDDGYFWSDQYDLRVQFAGRVTADSAVDVVTGSLDSESFVARCVTDGAVTGLLAANNPRQFALNQRDLAAQLTRVPAREGTPR